MAEWRLYEITETGEKWPSDAITFWNKSVEWPRWADRIRRKTLLDLPHLLILQFPDGAYQIYIDVSDE